MYELLASYPTATAVVTTLLFCSSLMLLVMIGAGILNDEDDQL